MNRIVGIWPNNQKKDFVNCVHLASHPMVLATSDDQGKVKLFKFPFLEKDVKLKKY